MEPKELMTDGITVETSDKTVAVRISTDPTMESRSPYEIVITAKDPGGTNLTPVSITRANPEEGIIQKTFSNIKNTISSEPTVAKPVTIQIGDSKQPNFFGTSSTDGEITIGSDNSLTFKDTNTWNGSYYRNGSGDFVPVPDEGIEIIPDVTEIRFGLYNTYNTKVTINNGAVKLIDTSGFAMNNDTVIGQINQTPVVKVWNNVKTGASDLGTLATNVVSNEIVKGLTPMLAVPVLIEGVMNRDTLSNFVIGLTQRGYYSPTLNAYIVNKDGKWYRVDTGQEVSSVQTYLKTTDFRGGDWLDYVSGQHNTINQSTFDSPEWKKFTNSVTKEIENNPNDLNAITKAVYNNMTYNPDVAATYSIDPKKSSLTDIIAIKFKGSFLESFIYKFSDRTFQNVIASDQFVCFDFATAEQSYLATRGVHTDLAVGNVDFGDGVAGSHAFLQYIDEEGNKYILDPTGGTVDKEADYIKNYKVTNLTITPSMYGSTN